MMHLNHFLFSLSYANPQQVSVQTPTGWTYSGSHVDYSSIVAVSIIRAGDSILDSFMSVCPEAAAGKILIQRDEHTAQSKLYYTKLPPLENKFVVVLDPMLATGGSCVTAIDECLKRGATIANM